MAFDRRMKKIVKNNINQKKSLDLWTALLFIFFLTSISSLVYRKKLFAIFSAKNQFLPKIVFF
jgi:hypothetical protein